MPGGPWSSSPGGTLVFPGGAAPLLDRRIAPWIVAPSRADLAWRPLPV